jgi:hypothetical protein
MSKKKWDADAIRARIDEVLPEGRVVPRHNEKGHFYEVRQGERSSYVGDNYMTTGPIYPSVTGKLQILKDEGLINYKMNRAIEYLSNFIFTNYKQFNDMNVMDMISEAVKTASRVSQDILMDAGDVGTRIHNIREDIFNEWIKTKKRPEDFLTFIPVGEEDVRVTSAIRALQKFCVEKDYIPVRCELLVYSHELKTAGTLDDLGLMRQVLREGLLGAEGKECSHPDGCMEDVRGKYTCLQCGYQYRYEFVLMDLKTSNQFKDHYFFQVCLYWWKLWKLLGKEWKPERCFILKVSKEDGTYKIEDLKQPSKLAAYARAMLKTNEGVEFIKGLRKDNQRNVIKL